MTQAEGSKERARGFRDEDESLLHHLEDQVLLERLWARQAPKGSPALPARAAGLLSELRKLEGGNEALSRALEGDVSAVFPLLLVERIGSQRPELAHQIAIYFDRLSSAFEAEVAREAVKGTDPRETWSASSDALVRTKIRSLAGWVALRDEKTYLIAAARRILGSELSPTEIEKAVLGIAYACFDDLGHAAKAGARKLDANARLALTVLSQVDEACRIAGSDAKSRTTIVRRAESIRAVAIDEALVPILDGLGGAKLRDDGEQIFPRLFADVARAWEWSGRDEAVERFAVDELNNIAWSIYRASRWDSLRALLAPCIELYDSMAARIESDPKRHIAYAAKCAQVFVFRSECETNRARELVLAERALTLCPSHRNGRLILAHLCCDNAIRRLNVPGYPPRAEIDLAKAEIARAAELFPQSKRLPDAQAKLKEIIERTGGVYVR